MLRTAASSARFFLAALPRLESNFEARWLMPWFGELPYHPIDGELADAVGHLEEGWSLVVGVED